MSKVAIVYWSGTGNTEAMADLIAQGVRAAGGTADLVHAADFTAERVEDYDALAFGCPAMGDEELEDMEFLPMYDQVEPHLAGHKNILRCHNSPSMFGGTQKHPPYHKNYPSYYTSEKIVFAIWRAHFLNLI